MDQVYFADLLGCECIEYTQKPVVQDLEGGELKVRIALFAWGFESLSLEKVFD